MIDIFKYSECRKFIKDYIQELKNSNPRLSQRNIALKTGIDPSFFSKIINGKRRISYTFGMRLAQLMKLTKPQRDFFELLIRCDQAKSSAEYMTIKEKIVVKVQSRLAAIKPDQSSFYSKWYNTVIRELLNVIVFKDDYESLSKMIIPMIKPHQVRVAVSLLKELQVIKETENGTLILSEQFITTDRNIPVPIIHDFQSQMINLAKTALVNVDKDSREISTITLSLSEDSFRKVRQRIIDLRNELFQIAHDEKNQMAGVYQINFQAFPVACIKRT